MQAVATWWGYAEGNTTLITLVVGLVVLAAVGFVGHRLWERRR